jgi:uncharacterized protein (DUF169 family)
MTNWKELNQNLTELLKLDSRIIAVKRMENKEGLGNIQGIEKPESAFTYCQLPYLVRKQGKTIGITREDATPLAEKMQLRYRCLRIQGLAPADDAQIKNVAKGFTGFWFNDYKTAKKAVGSYPTPSPIEALAMSPLDEEKFEPDYLLIYANGGQMTLLMNGLQYYEYERVESSFSGEGSCTDALPRCVATGKPSLCLPCLGERSFGRVKDDEMVIALPADRLKRTVKGLKTMKETGLGYPIGHQEAGIYFFNAKVFYYQIHQLCFSSINLNSQSIVRCFFSNNCGNDQSF